MRRIAGIALFTFLLQFSSLECFSQLRSPSEFNRDGINIEHTYFVLYDATEAGFGWASEWTQTTARTYADKTAFFKWHFKDGSFAFTRQGDHIGDIGMITKYLLTDESGKLSDIKGNAIQPMTLDNYPVKIELWLGTKEDREDIKPEILVDAVCNDQTDIQYGYAYYFNDCP